MNESKMASVLKTYYGADDYLGEAIRMETSICLTCDGEGVVFFVTAEDGHRTKITASKTFSDWLEYTVYGTNEFETRIERVCARFGCTWDFERKELYILFRRNEFSLAEGYFRLMQCAYILAYLA
jgi:hypothetical protein